MKINLTKTKYLVINDYYQNLDVEDTQEHTEYIEVKYLGVQIRKRGINEKKINLGTSAMLNGVLGDKC